MRREHRGDPRPLRHAALSCVLLIAWGVAGRGTAARPFLPAPVYGVGHNPTRLATADFDGDGRADVAVANSGNSGESVTVSLLLSEGGGLFRNAGVLTTTSPGSATALAAGDFNLDGKQDLLLETNSGSTYSARVLLGQGNGTFTAVVPDLALPGLLTVGDSNADGRLDLLVRSGLGTASQLRVWLGAGNGTFTPLAAFPAPAGIDFSKSPFSAADLTGDHVVDIVATSSTGTSSIVLTGTTLGTFVVGQTLATTQPNSVSGLADATGDGIVDFVVQVQGATNEEWRAYRGHGDGTFDAAPFWTRTVAGQSFDLTIGDLTRDGFPDLVMCGGQQAQIWTGTGGSFTFSPPFTVGDGGIRAVAGDFDGSSGFDLALSAGFSNTVTFVLARPDGSYLPAPLPDPDPVAFVGDIVAADFNGDGRTDIAALHDRPTLCDEPPCPWGEVELRLAQPAGGFVDSSLSIVGNRPQSLHAVDLDLDGKLDLVSANVVDDGSDQIIDPGSLSLLRGHGDGTFDAAVTVPAGQVPVWAAAGDLDHDGDIDLAEVNSYSNTVVVFLRNGAGAYVPQAPLNAGRFAKQVDLTDVDGDGNVDLVITNGGSTGLPGGVSWLRGHGNGTFDARLVIASVENGAGLALGDLDGDGDVDFALSDAGLGIDPADVGGVTVLLHQAGAAFAASAPYFVGTQPARPRLADFNGDGAPDLMVEADDTLAVLPGLGGGLFGAVERFAALTCTTFRPAQLVGDADMDLFGACSNVAVFENGADQNPDLRFLDNTRLNWDPISFIGAFDVLQGSLPLLRSTGGNFGTAVQACLANNATSHAMDIPATPAVGSGSFYLVRAVRPNGTGGSYDGEMPGQKAPRDASIAASASACP